MRVNRRHELFGHVPDSDWYNWKWQIANRIETVEELKKYLPLSEEEEEAISKALQKLRMAITPYYLSLIDPNDPNDPIRKRAVPTIHELYQAPEDLVDPLYEDVDSPVPGLTHRYPDRVLMLVTDQCSMYCRHCTRRRFAGETDAPMPMDKIEKQIEYIRNTPQIRDVLISGGDPLTLSDSRLEEIIKRLREIPHVEIIRIGSSVPVVLPMRITPELVNMLKKYHPIWLNTHFNHPHEITEDSKRACEMLADAGIPLGNQTVLLRGVNDCVHVMKKLVHELVKIRVRPYYIYQCDLSFGLSHFRTPVSKGIEIIEGLRGHTSGYCVPTFVVDAPGGGGKIPVGPNYVISQSHDKIVLRNYEGVIVTYVEPKDYTPGPCVCDEEVPKSEGVAGLMQKDTIGVLEPENLERKKRRRKDEK
ncbi:MAG: Lysine 2,3-aminomutase [Caldanaerobacter subterraneus]|uniref:L-lysine 2,3-aminomutase n=3 Tax=Caldanaerobacter subterraneus TaxID=911092 RepID=Q8RBT6_CALS4|nr:lysine 2,3-aminomutase [Caldanaerobacter subterraneus]AAM23985.1 Lysine 2,3-aminomutase [Caldanaerobacter subterraneus subsp. tengcongensis MB4]KUK08289.1 MAG: Lysine 2,3-aminomutase [Caldanaerobacter subterraneus]MCS3916495.1 lysine 2,3-aminomutase [Caldanaerobacter subterraneus subsp. tengcongensis MB4]NNG67090.1 lysine 2,3-aminomutase [Caldanaerobacter subterraneus]HBT48489.1 lysine 2,3-aminomutase [Caldanaerobacter subterraneus]